MVDEEEFGEEVTLICTGMRSRSSSTWLMMPTRRPDRR